MKTIQCPHCHTEIPFDALFCPACGQSLPRSSAAPPSQPVEVSSTGSAARCPRCGFQHKPPLPIHCQACGYPLSTLAASGPAPLPPAPMPQKQPEIPLPGIKTQPTALGAVPHRPGRLRGARRKAIFLLIGAVLLAAAGFFGWQWWQNRPAGGGGQPTVEACQPVEPDDKYEPANQSDLQGDLRRDSYFKAGEEYTIAENAEFNVPSGVTLIIEPGARVRFGEGARMVVKGRLLACGKSNRRILFTANSTTGSPGYWAGIEIRGADPEAVIGHASFEYAGRDHHAALWVEAIDLHLEDLKFDGNAWYAISLDPNSAPRLRRPLEVKNGPQGWEIRAGELTAARTWNSQQPYVVRELLTIGAEGSLNLEPGTTVKFLPNGAINIKGDLQAIGKPDLPVRFTSYNNDEEEGSQEPASGDWVGLRFYGRDGQSRLENVEIAYGGQGGFREVGCVWMENAAPSLVNVTLSECAGYALSTDIASEPQVEQLAISEIDPLRRWELRESTLQGVTSRRLSKLPTADQSSLYPVLTGWVGAGEGAALTIDPGMTLLFAGGNRAGLWVEGKLLASGSAREPIMLTSWRDPAFNNAGGPQPGDWGGLHLKNIDSQGTELANIEIRYAGAAENTCLLLLNASPKISQLKIRDCAAYPVSSDAASLPAVEAVDLSENQRPNLWEIRQSTLQERAEWAWGSLPAGKDGQIIRLVTGSVTVEKEATLKLEAGLTLKFADGAGILARGGFSAEGTPEKPILLTSWRDPEAGGQESGAQPGDWAGVTLDSSQSANLKYVRIRYAGRPDWGAGCLNIKESKPTLDNLSIDHCNYYPITSDLGSDAAIEGLLLQENRPADEWAIRESTLAKGNQRTWAPILQPGREDPVLRTVTGWLTIEEGARLALRDGLVVKFAQGIGLLNRGVLDVAGKEQSPVILTSWRDSQFSTESGVQSGDWAGLTFEGAQSDASLSQVEIRYAGGRGNQRGAINLSACSPLLSGVTIRDAPYYPISVDAQSAPRLEGITLLNNARAIEVRGGELRAAGEQVWSPWTDAGGQPIVRVIAENLVIGPEASLRMTVGTILKFDINAGLDVYGGLLAEGATFTSLRDDETGDDTDGSASGELAWQGIKIHGRKVTRLQDSLVRYARVGLWMEDATPVLTDLRIEDSWEAALNGDALSAPEIANLSLLHNAVNGLLIRAESLPEGETHWRLIGTSHEQVVRVIPKTFTIGPNSMLLLDPELVIKFAPQAALVVEGKLQAGQKEASPVYLTALADDSVGADTDNSLQVPSRGSWKGIVVNPNNSGAQLSIFGVTIRYAETGLFLVNLPSWEFSGLTISDSLLYGISCDLLSLFTPEDPEITLVNNGEDSLSCPTPGR